MRVSLRVRPGASRTSVGGSYAGALVVTVQTQAVDGKATETALAAVAKELGVPRRDVTMVSGRTSRTKVVEVPDACEDRVLELLAESTLS